MSDIHTIPLDELLADHADIIGDIKICQLALAAGLETYGKDNSSTKERLEKNLEVLSVIEAEMRRRKEVQDR